MEEKEIERMHARAIGKKDYPANHKCPYDFAKEPHTHLAYWDGWDESALEAELKRSPLLRERKGAAR